MNLHEIFPIFFYFLRFFVYRCAKLWVTSLLNHSCAEVG